MNKAVVDDFVIDRSRVVDVERKKDKIERLFSVVVSFGNVAPDLENREKQWVGLEGESDDRRNAKEYIVALCHPEDKIKMTVTPSLSTDSDLQLEKVEKLTRAAISVNDNCEIIISGTDLAVTLAMSAIEDLLERSEQAEQTDAIKGEPDKARKEKRLSSEAALRLDTRFERALSQHSDGSCTPKDYEYTADAVKRVMLQCWSDDKASGVGNSALPGSVVTDAVASNGANLGASNSDMKTRSATPESNEARAAGSSGPKSDQPSSFITTLGKQVNEIKLDSAKTLTSSAQADSGQLKSAASAFNLRDFAKQCGYQEEDIDAVLKIGPAQMTPKEFLTRLYENKSTKGTSQEPDSLLFSSGIGASVHSKTNSISEIIQSKTDNFNPDRRRSSSEVFLSKEVNAGSPTAPLANYWQRLARDFQEEDECTDINELKQRNAERQQLIKSVFTQQTQSQGNVNKSVALQNQVPNQQKPSKNKKKKGKNSAKASPNLKQNGAVQSEKNSSPVFLVDLTSEDSADISGGKRESSPGLLVNLTDGAIQGSSAERQNSQVSGDFSETCLMEVWQPAILSNDGKASHRPHVPPYQNNPWPAHPPGYRQQLNSGWPVNTYVGGVRGKHPMQTQRQLRHIIIDGSNVAMKHGNDKVFSCLGIKLCIDYFLKRGHTEVTAFVPQWRTRMPTPNNPQLRQDLLDTLKDQGNLVFTPSRKVDGRHIVCYDDRFVLKLAEETDGVIVSNDNYRDLMMESPTWKKMIQERLLMYSFVGDLFMPPDDPLGRNGPTLDEFLCKQSQQPMNKKTRALSPQPLMSMRVGRPNFRYQNPGYVHQQQHGLQNFNPALQQQQQPRQVWNPKRNKPVPGRSQQETDHLATLLRSLFPTKEQEEKIYQVLQNHRSEKDINKLSNYIMNICPL